MNNLKEFIETLSQGGGATYSLALGNSPTTGFIVADGLNERTHKALNKGQSDTFTLLGLKRLVSEYVSDKAELLADENNFLGGWFDDSVLYLDISNVIKKRFDAALAGLERRQLAIFHIDEQKCIDLPTKRQSSGTHYQQQAYVRTLAKEV